jgi:putative PIN family toxin of toxin-antitoxin system
MRRVVLDTNVLVAGLRSNDGASFALLMHMAQSRIKVLATTALFLEYEAVLRRPEQIEFHGRSRKEIESFLTEFANLAEPVNRRYVWRPQLPDPKDEMVLEAAINGRADYLVTHNMGDFLVVKDRFNIRIMRPNELVKELEQ